MVFTSTFCVPVVTSTLRPVVSPFSSAVRAGLRWVGSVHASLSARVWPWADVAVLRARLSGSCTLPFAVGFAVSLSVRRVVLTCYRFYVVLHRVLSVGPGWLAGAFFRVLPHLRFVSPFGFRSSPPPFFDVQCGLPPSSYLITSLAVSCVLGLSPQLAACTSVL